MKLKTLIKSTTVALLLSAKLVNAQIPAAYANDPVVQQVSEQLAAQGYEVTEVKKTILGRYKIEAVAPGYEREIVVTAGGGTVLRDEWKATDGGSASSGGLPDVSGPDDSGLDDGNEDGEDGLDDSNEDESDDEPDDGNDSGSDDGNDDGSDDDNDDESNDGSDDEPEDEDPEVEIDGQ